MIFRYYYGKQLGTFFDYFSILFVFLSFTVGVVFEEHYGMSRYVGGIGLVVVVGISVWFGPLIVVVQRELIVANTREGLAAARARRRTGGRRPKLAPDQAHHAQQLYDAGNHTVQRIADLLQVPRSTIYGHLNKESIGRRPTDKGPMQA